MALPGKQQGWRWGFQSCNGLSAGADLSTWRDPHLWEDVMAVHREKPLVAMCGGGDQIYNDALWQSPSLQSWVSGVSTHVSQSIILSLTFHLLFSVVGNLGHLHPGSYSPWLMTEAH